MGDIGEREIVARFRAARGYAGMGQRELAEAIGWGTSAWNRVEKGVTTVRPRELDGVIAKVAQATGVPADWFTAPWEHVGTTEAPATDGNVIEPAEPVWVGRLENHLQTIIDVITAARPDAAADATVSELPGADEEPEAPRRRRPRH